MRTTTVFVLFPQLFHFHSCSTQVSSQELADLLCTMKIAANEAEALQLINDEINYDHDEFISFDEFFMWMLEVRASEKRKGRIPSRARNDFSSDDNDSP